MNKKVLVFTIALIITIFMLSTAFAQNSGWVKIFDDHYDLVSNVDGLAIMNRVDTPEDLMKLAQFIDESPSFQHEGRHPILPEPLFKGLGQGSLKHELKADQLVLNYTVSLPRDNNPHHKAFLRVIDAKGKKILSPEPNSGIDYILSDPAFKNYIFTDEHLWLVDADTMMVKQLTSDKAHGFDRARIIENVSSNDETNYLFWAYKPFWNPKGTLVSFETNREVLRSGMSIWVVDPQTSEEKPVITAKDGLTTIDWVNDDQIAYFVREFSNGVPNHNINLVNVHTGAISTVISNVWPLAANQNGIIYRDGEQICLIDLAGQNQVTLASNQANHFYDDFVAYSPNGDKVMLKARTMDGKQTLVIINLTTFAKLNIAEPEGNMIHFEPVWIDDESIMVKTQSWPGSKEVVYSTWSYQL